MRNSFAAAITFLIGGALYLLFTGSASVAQGCAAIVLASFATFLALRAGRVLRVRVFRPAKVQSEGTSSPRQATRGALRLVPRLWRTSIDAAGIRIDGLDGDRGVADTGRRALKIFAQSFLPNAYVIRERRRSLEVRDAFANEDEP